MTSLLLALVSITLKWDASPPSDNVTQYVVEKKQPDGSWAEVLKVNSTTSAVVTEQTPGAYTYRVRAFNGWLSEPSNEASTAQPSAPKGLVISSVK